MGMIQDVLTQDVDAIILSTHDEGAAAPLVKQAVDAGIAVIIVNSDIANFPTPVHGVVGYSQRNGTFAEGEYILDMFDGEAKVGVLEGVQRVERQGDQVILYGQGAQLIGAVVNTLESEGIAFNNLRSDAANLEDVFLALTGRQIEN